MNERKVPGMWKCSKCGFLLIRRTIYVHSGTVGVPRDDEAPKCDNDGSLMEAVKELLN